MIHTRIFDTEEEAIAFAEGVEFVNDSSFEIESVEPASGDEVASYSRGLWVVTILDYNSEEQN